MNPREVFKSKTGRAGDWTAERIGRMTVQDIRQLRENAERLQQAAVAALCDEALKAHSGARRARPASPGAGTKARVLIARIKAFEARSVYLQDARSSWGGVRKSDGAVVLALWADAVEPSEGGCRYLLWAPNADGTRPWSDKPAGKERLEHCKRAIELGAAEGLLVYGQRLDGHLPEDKAYAVHGVDAETVLSFEVRQEGAAYWAVWGRKAARAIPAPETVYKG
ncbi:MAG: hypothetical protein ACT4P4_29150 [Betaproteobacteria bacterium]